MKVQLKTLTKESDKLFFRQRYESISGLEIPRSYFNASKTFTFSNKERILGGFMLGSGPDFRTVNMFVSPIHHELFYNIINLNDFVEVCCFWIDHKYRKHKYLNALLWLKLAYAVTAQPESYVLFGTNSLGLAKMYGRPRKSLLFHHDEIDKKQTFIFIARRKEFAAGVWEIILQKMLSIKFGKPLKEKPNLKNALTYELSK